MSYQTTPTGNNYNWATAPDDVVYNVVIPYIKQLENDQSQRRLQWIQFARMYQNQDPSALFATSMAGAGTSAHLSRWSSRNVIKSSIDTTTSKIGKSKPRPILLTEGGNYTLQKKGKQLTQFLDGSFAHMGIYDKGAQVFKDGGIFGIGGLKFFIDTERGTVECERILMDEIIIDEADSIYGQPSQIHHRKYISKQKLLAKYPGKKMEIERAASAFSDASVAARNRDLIRIYESWQLPSKPGAKDGKVVRSIDTCTLSVDVWEKDYFPFVFWRWCERVSGFWGLGIAEELFGTQLSINQTLKNIQQAQNLIAVPRIFIRPGAMPQVQMDNRIGALITTTQTPDFSSPQAMGPEIYNYLETQVRGAYDQIGIGELSATGQKPAGLDSGAAIREYQDVVSERFMVIGQKWESFYLECANIVIDLTKDLMTMSKSDDKVKAPRIKVQDKNFLKTINWAQVDLDEDKYTLRMFAANILPTQPAARLAKVQELVQSGWIPEEEGLRLLDFPDLQAYSNKRLASANLTDKMIENIIEHGKYMSPEPQMNLQQALATGQERFLEAKLDGVAPARLSMMNRWLEAIKAMTPATPQAVNPMSPVEPGGGPIATPESAPTSELLPFQQPGA